jgi:hypothetical protein
MVGGRKKEKEKGEEEEGRCGNPGWVRVTKGVAVADVESEGW